MNTTERFNNSLDSKNLKEFTELVNTSSQYINDIFANGLLHHMLSKYPELPLEFYKFVINNPNTDLNNNDPNILPPVLRTSRDDIIDLLLSKPALNVNLELLGNKSISKHAIDENNLSLLDKLTKTGKLDITQAELLNYAISKNMEAFRILLGLLEPYMCDALQPVDHAIRSNNAEALDLLLGAGCSINIQSIGMLVNTNSTSMTSILIKYLTKVSNKKAVLAIAVKNNNIELFRAVGKFVRDIDYDDMYKSLDKTELMDEIIHLANDTNDPELIRTIFMAVIKSRNSKHYLLLDKLTVNKKVVFGVVDLLVPFNKLDELGELIENTDVLKGVIGDVVNNDPDFLSTLIKAGKFSAVKKIVAEYDLGLEGKRLNIEGFIAKGQYDILLELLTKYKISLGELGLIDTLVLNDKYELALLLVEKYEMVPTNPRLIEKMLDKPEIIKAIIRKRPEFLSSGMSVDSIIRIMDIIGDDSTLLETFTESLNADRFRRLITVKSNLDRILQNPDHLLKLSKSESIIDILFEEYSDKAPKSPWIEDDDDEDDDEDDEEDEEENSKYVLFELLNVLDKDKRDVLMDMVRNSGSFGDLLAIKPLECVITMDDSELFQYIARYLKDDLEKVSLLKLLVLNPTITLENIDDILALSVTKVTDAFCNLILLLDDEEFNELFRSSNVIDKLLEHPNMKVNSLVPKDWNYPKGEKISLLDFVAGDIGGDDYDVKNWKNMEHLRILKKLLEDTKLDVNIENTEKETIAHYIIRNIFTFANIDYESDEHFSYPHAVLKLIISHPRFDINANRKVFPTIFSDNQGDYSYLLTLLVSRPECDVNYCRLLHSACSGKKLDMLRVLLSLANVDVNLVAVDDKEGTRVTPMHLAIEGRFVDGVKLLLEDPRFDINVLDSKGNNYSRLAAASGLREIVALFAARGVVDDKQERIDREIAEYEAKMAAQGRVKQARIRETLNSFDLILKEREAVDESFKQGFSGNITAFSRSLCPFCLTYLEKDQPYECLYLAAHRCPEELENEPLKRLYFGDEWQTKNFEICCTCGRPCEHHGHFTPVENSGPSELARNDDMANHWVCNEHNGGGGKLEMVTRLIGMLSELKRRVDSDERLVYGPELIKELAMIANASLFNGAIRDRAIGVLERKKWNVNSKIPKYAKFNAPNEVKRNNGNNANKSKRNAREPIVHYDNPDEELQCMICLDEAEHLFKPHEGDEGYICDQCIKRQVCASRYASVTCELGCRPKKQIYKDDVNALMGGNFCEDVEMAEPEQWAEEE